MCLLLGLLIYGTDLNGQNVSSYTIDEGQWGTPFAADATNLTVATVNVKEYSGLSIQKDANVRLNKVNCYNESSLFVASSKNIKIGPGSRFRAGSSVLLFVDSNYFSGSCPLPGGRAAANIAEIATDAAPALSVAEAVTVYPNPFTAEVTVAFEAGQAQPVQFALYDLLGNQLAVQQYDGSHGEVNGRGVIKYDGSQLPAGVYLYKVQLGETVQSGRIMKQ